MLTTRIFCKDTTFLRISNAIYRNFVTLQPKMRIQRKRIATAWLLLSIFVSMMMLTALHHHQPTANTADCVECDHHVQHHSHLTAATTSMHECLLCQFLSIPYISATVIATMLFATIIRIVPRHRLVCIVNGGGNALSTRAPPVSYSVA